MEAELLYPTTSTDEISIAAAVATLPFPPVSVGLVPTSWNARRSEGVVPQFDLEIDSTGALNLTAGELLGGKLRARAIAATAVDSIANATDTFTEAAHGFLTGDGPVQATTSNTLPVGLALATDYWIVKTGANTFKLALSFADAMAATPVVVNITSDGAGVLTLTGAAAKRVIFYSYGLLETPIALDVQRGWWTRFDHRPGVVCYAVVGALSAGTASIRMMPVVLG